MWILNVALADLTIHSCQAWPLVATPVRLLHFTLIMEADLPSIFILMKKKQNVSLIQIEHI